MPGASGRGIGSCVGGGAYTEPHRSSEQRGARFAESMSGQRFTADTEECS